MGCTWPFPRTLHCWLRHIFSQFCDVCTWSHMFRIPTSYGTSRKNLDVLGLALTFCTCSSKSSAAAESDKDSKKKKSSKSKTDPLQQYKDDKKPKRVESKDAKNKSKKKV